MVRSRPSTVPPTRATRIAVIYQEPTLFPDLSIAENVMMGRHPLGSGRRIDFKALNRTVKDLLDRLGVKLDPEQPVRACRSPISRSSKSPRRSRSTRAC